jgi:RimJ/RimL family protein N-acetyltransferase
VPLLVDPTLPEGTLCGATQPRLTTNDGLVLRPWQQEDADAVLTAFACPDIQRWHVRRLDTPDEAAEWVAQWADRWKTETAASWAVVDAAGLGGTGFGGTRFGGTGFDRAGADRAGLDGGAVDGGALDGAGLDGGGLDGGGLGGARLDGARLDGARFGRAGADGISTAAGGSQPLGQIGLRSISLAEGSASLSYWVTPAARGRSIAVRSVQALSAWAFESIGFNRLSIQHSTANTASCQVAERTGYRVEGTLRQAIKHADGWHDWHLHGRLRTDG